MKKHLLIIAALALNVLPSLAEINFSASGNYYKMDDDEVDGIDAVFLFNGITAETQITYNNTDFVEWQDFDSAFISNAPCFSPDEGGYRVKIKKADDKRYRYIDIWVFDYSNYIVTIDDVQWTFGDDKCTKLSIDVMLSYRKEKMIYKTPTGEKELPRTFTLTYNDAEWSGSAWTKKELSLYPFTSIPIESPLCNTTFTLTGDAYATAFNLPNEFVTDVFHPIAVKAYPKGEIAKRDAKNEIDQTSTTSSTGGGGTSENCKCKQEILAAVASEPTIGGSAPLVVDFKSNVNEDAVDFTEWFISENATPAQKIRYTDTDFRYTFNSAGEYTVKLVASSAECEYTDSVKVVVLESFIDVPNVFTPNGDGVNDEFRVVYRSLLSFEASVYNRWGRLVYRWSDPAKGWDGKINGKMASPGAYYYVIQATGADKDKKGEPIEWKCSGDINLLRGKSKK